MLLLLLLLYLTSFNKLLAKPLMEWHYMFIQSLRLIHLPLTKIAKTIRMP